MGTPRPSRTKKMSASGPGPAPALPGAEITVAQLLRSENSTPQGSRLRTKLDKCALGSSLVATNLLKLDARQVFFTLLDVEQADIEHFTEILEHGLPYFVRTELNSQMTQLRPFQKKFMEEAREAWNPAPGGKVHKRLLMVAATGSGKSAMIAMAPFVGARERCIVVVPNL